MKTYLSISLFQKRVNSILFRLLVIAYGIFVISFLKENPFPWFVYPMIFIFYVIVYISVLKKSVIRLINDFLFIFLISLGKDPMNVVIFCFLLLPIYNNVNFSGGRRSKLLVPLTILVFVGLLLFYKDWILPDYSEYLIVLIPIISLSFINYFTSLRDKLRDFRESLIDSVDTYYLKNIRKPHRVYKGLIHSLNNIFKSKVIKGVVCLSINKENNEDLLVMNSSFIVYGIEVKNDLVNKVRERKVFQTNQIDINQVNRSCLCIFVKVNEHEHIYLFILNEPIPIYYYLIGFFKSLYPTLTKISNIIISERELQEIKTREMSRLLVSHVYVNKANSTMHFIRNRLTPLYNLVLLTRRYKTVKEDEMPEYIELLNNEVERADNELKSITSRANSMLENDDNPFVYKDLKPVSSDKIFYTIKRLYSSLFPYKQLEILQSPSDTHKRYIQINEEGLEILLADWLNNMNKYSVSHATCAVLFHQDYLQIIFQNDHKLIKEDLRRLIEDLMSENRNEIMKRTTRGLYTIKSILDDMRVKYNVDEKENGRLLELNLTLQFVSDENSNF